MIQSKNDRSIFPFLAICLILVSCTSGFSTKETVQKLTSSEMVFEVTLPKKIEGNETIYLEILDEVTGIALNPTRYEMLPKDELSLYVRIPIINGSFIKYRYIMHADVDLIERCPDGSQVQFRSFLVNRPAVIKDIISSWTNENLELTYGEISGFIYDAKTNLPIPEIIISVNGASAFTSSDGYYQIRNVPVGERHLVAFHPDGLYEPFQQGAVIAENGVTPASFGMNPAKMVEITFNVEVPEYTDHDASLRFIGNFYSLGNIFSEVTGGTSIISSRAPVLDNRGNRKYSITLELPAGADLRYKYSLGDGFINAEYSTVGNFRMRQLIVPEKNTNIRNFIESWSSKGKPPVTFHVTAPNLTPDSDIVSIQFNPFMWTQPIQMWKTGENQWSYTLYSPFEFLDRSQFRFCRNDLCGYADDELTAGINANGFVLNLQSSSEQRSIDYEIEKWAGMDSISYEIQKVKNHFINENFIKGIEFSQEYDPKWLPFLDWGFIDAAVSGVNTIVFTPSWIFENGNIPKVKYDYSKNPSYKDILETINYAQDAGLTLALYPRPNFSSESDDEYWASAPLTYNWWLEWFSLYERFILNYADFAQKNNVEIFIFGGESILPALPEGRLSSGKPSNAPYDFTEKWIALNEKVRNKFSGQVIFSLPVSFTEKIDHEFLSNVDAILIENAGALASSTSPTIDELEFQFAQILDQSIYSLHDHYQKPIMIGINYPSIDGSASDCINYDNSCSEMLDKSSSESLSIDMNEQADIYSAILNTIIDRNWISGIVSQGYYPAVVVRDASSSVRGKSSMDVLSYYFNEVIQ